MEYILRQVFITLILLPFIQISSSQGGEYTEWAQWTNPLCDVTCGQSVLKPVYRNRGCIFTPSNCTGPFLESKEVLCGVPNCPVDGGYSQWSPWSSQACSATCQGTQQVSRSRFCNNPAPQFNGRPCQGQSVETDQRACGDEKCPGQDLLSPWSSWSSPQCPVTCGGTNGTVTRARICVTPDNPTTGCTASLTEREVRECGPSNCPVHGGVSAWDNWSVNSPCSPTCGANGIRTRTRTRTCTNPVPAYSGRFCAQPLVATETIVCAPVPCQDVVSSWTSWEVPTCQVQATCGVLAVVNITRSRTCTSPANGVLCSVSLTETKSFSCGAAQCPAIHGGISMWSVWGEGPCSATCGSAVRNVIRNRTCTNPVPQYGGNDCSETRSESMTRTCSGLPSCPTMSALTGGILVGVFILLGILLILIIVGFLWCMCRRKDEVLYKKENIRQSEFHQYENVKPGFLKSPYYNLEK
ncbi:coadhesin-like [Haliotis asinina]|uniref:coadhesin-like n=1 Tax=Haliotis asinina TaxID=109174 RepID=UPI003531E6CE